MFYKYEKTYRIVVPQINVKGKHFLSDADTSRLLNGNVHVFEKLDGANVGIIRHKDYFKLQKRGSLIGDSEHLQFQFFKAWSNQNYEKIMSLPENTVLYGELMFCKHSIFYDKLPDYFIPFAMINKQTRKYYNYKDFKSICDSSGFTPAPLIYNGPVSVMDLFDFIPKISYFSNSEPAEGIVVWNYKKGLRGKVVREEFIKNMEDADHWTKQTPTKNLLEK